MSWSYCSSFGVIVAALQLTPSAAAQTEPGGKDPTRAAGASSVSAVLEATVPSAETASVELHVIDLHEALRRALRNPAAVLLALANVVRSEAQERYERGAYLPRLSTETRGGIAYENRPVLPAGSTVLELPDGDTLTLTQSESSSRIDATSMTVRADATLEWVVLDPARGRTVAAAKASTKSQREALHSSQRASAQAACELYLRALAARALVEDAQLSAERRAAQHVAIGALVRSGMRPTVDAQRAEIELVRASHVLAMRRVEERSLGAALALATGGDPLIPVWPAPLEGNPLAGPDDALSATELAVERRPELRQLERLIDARRQQHKAAQAAGWPSLGISGTASVTHQDVRRGQGLEGYLMSHYGGAYLRWNALDPSVWRNVGLTRAALQQAEAQRQEVWFRVRGEVVDATYRVQRTQTLLEQATQVLEIARVTRDAQSERYRAGVASLLELLDAEAIEQSARFARIEAERDHLVARAMLLAACGVLEELAR